MLQILHRVGLALIVFGLLDIGLMIYCIFNGVSYSSSFNIFAVSFNLEAVSVAVPATNSVPLHPANLNCDQ